MLFILVLRVKTRKHTAGNGLNASCRNFDHMTDIDLTFRRSSAVRQVKLRFQR